MNIGERSLYRQADEKGQWIYYSTTKSWYTPKEFVQYIDKNGSFPDYNSLMVADPCEALNRSNSTLYSLIQRRDLFQRRVLEYYRGK